MILTFRYRVKDASTARRLRQMARAVNYVWNYCRETTEASRSRNKRWPTAFDLINLTSGTSKDLGIQAETINEVCREFAKRRDLSKRMLKWRGRKSLGWVPFGDWSVRLRDGAAVYRKRAYRLWLHRPPEGKIRSGSFSEDSRGRWYINLQCEVDPVASVACGEIGIDLGLKTLAALSDGTVIENPRFFNQHAEALATAQRASRRKRVRAIHAKIQNARRHHHHVHTTRLVRRFKRIVVGNISAKAMKETFAGKAVSDAAWSMFRQQLRYKAIRHGAEYVEVNEAYSSQTCSACGVRSGPKGRKGLEVREWTCGECGVVHDRDVNAARNILGPERRPPVAEIAA